MRASILHFGGFLALAAATATAAFVVVPAFEQAAERIAHPNARYQLTLELDGQYYIADHDMSHSDCMERIHTVADWTDGHARYSCDRQPMQK